MNIADMVYQDDANRITEWHLQMTDMHVNLIWLKWPLHVFLNLGVAPP